MSEIQTPTETLTVAKRGPGRPKGAKTRKKLGERAPVERKAASRHDRDGGAPVDGDYGFGQVANANDAYDYAAVSDADQPSLGAKGYWPETFGPGCATFKWDPRARDGHPNKYKPGDEQRMGGATLMKVHKDHIAAVRKAEHTEFQQKKYANDQIAVNSGGQAAHGYGEIPFGGN